MRQYTPGNEVTFATTFIDAATNKPVSPTNVVLKLRDPTGTEVDLTPVEIGEGNFSAQYTPAIPGLWSYRWSGTGNGITAGREGSFNVNATDF